MLLIYVRHLRKLQIVYYGKNIGFSLSVTSGIIVGLLCKGGQHGHARQCCSDEEYAEIFKNGYRKLVQNVSSYCKDILIVAYTPCKEDNLLKWDNDKNRELEKRNQIAREVAEEFNLPYIDLWSELINARYEFEDPVHVKSEGNDFIAAYLCKYI